MSQLAGLEYIAYAVATSPGLSELLNEGHHRTFGADGLTRVDVVGSGESPVAAPVELVAEQGDTLTFIVHDDLPKTFVLTVLSPNAAELTVTGGVNWVRCAVALVSLPETDHDH
jgi:hypothetical protein